jgi:hypothetical protein
VSVARVVTEKLFSFSVIFGGKMEEVVVTLVPFPIVKNNDNDWRSSWCAVSSGDCCSDFFAQIFLKKKKSVFGVSEVHMYLVNCHNIEIHIFESFKIAIHIFNGVNEGKVYPNGYKCFSRGKKLFTPAESCYQVKDRFF